MAGLLNVVHVLVTVAMWFTFNISMSSVTKWTYLYGQVCSKHKYINAAGELIQTNASLGAVDSCQTYKFPFLITAMHMFVSWFACLIVVRQRTNIVSMPFREQLSKIAPLAAIRGAIGITGKH